VATLTATGAALAKKNGDRLRLLAAFECVAQGHDQAAPILMVRVAPLATRKMVILGSCRPTPGLRCGYCGVSSVQRVGCERSR